MDEAPNTGSPTVPQPSERTIRDLVLAVVIETAPNEVRYFDELCEMYFADPVAALNPTERDVPAAWGTEVAQWITQILLAAMSGLASDEIKEATKHAFDAARKRPHWPGTRRRTRAITPSLAGTTVSLPVGVGTAQTIVNDFKTISVGFNIPSELVGKVSVTVFAQLTASPENPPVQAETPASGPSES